MNKYALLRDDTLAIATWVTNNIKKVPDGVDVVDNHPWTIVQRRLGKSDQFSDILSVLLVYAGIESFFRAIDIEEATHAAGKYPLTFFRLEDGWSIIDPYAGFYFVNKDGGFASLPDLREGRWKAISLGNEPVRKGKLLWFYAKLFPRLPSGEAINHTNIYERGGRASTQNPAGRFLYEIEKNWKRL